MNVKQHLAAFQDAVAAGDLDGAAVVLHRLPDVAKPAARAELARLRGEAERMARFDGRKAEGRGAPEGVALHRRTS